MKHNMRLLLIILGIFGIHSLYSIQTPEKIQFQKIDVQDHTIVNQITGSVFTQDHHPLSNIHLCLIKLDKISQKQQNNRLHCYKTTISDKQGYFKSTIIDQGTYQIKYEDKQHKYKTYISPSIVVRENHLIQGQQWNMKPAYLKITEQYFKLKKEVRIYIKNKLNNQLVKQKMWIQLQLDLDNTPVKCTLYEEEFYSCPLYKEIEITKHESTELKLWLKVTYQDNTFDIQNQIIIKNPVNQPVKDRLVISKQSNNYKLVEENKQYLYTLLCDTQLAQDSVTLEFQTYFPRIDQESDFFDSHKIIANFMGDITKSIALSFTINKQNFRQVISLKNFDHKLATIEHNYSHRNFNIQMYIYKKKKNGSWELNNNYQNPLKQSYAIEASSINYITINLKNVTTTKKQTNIQVSGNICLDIPDEKNCSKEDIPNRAEIILKLPNKNLFFFTNSSKQNVFSEIIIESLKASQIKEISISYRPSTYQTVNLIKCSPESTMPDCFVWDDENKHLQLPYINLIHKKNYIQELYLELTSINSQSKRLPFSLPIKLEIEGNSFFVETSQNSSTTVRVELNQGCYIGEKINITITPTIPLALKQILSTIRPKSDIPYQTSITCTPTNHYHLNVMYKHGIYIKGSVFNTSHQGAQDLSLMIKYHGNILHEIRTNAEGQFLFHLTDTFLKLPSKEVLHIYTKDVSKPLKEISLYNYKIGDTINTEIIIQDSDTGIELWSLVGHVYDENNLSGIEKVKVQLHKTHLDQKIDIGQAYTQNNCQDKSSCIFQISHLSIPKRYDITSVLKSYSISMEHPYYQARDSISVADMITNISILKEKKQIIIHAQKDNLFLRPIKTISLLIKSSMSFTSQNITPSSVFIKYIQNNILVQIQDSTKNILYKGKLESPIVLTWEQGIMQALQNEKTNNIKFQYFLKEPHEIHMVMEEVQSLKELCSVNITEIHLKPHLVFKAQIHKQQFDIVALQMNFSQALLQRTKLPASFHLNDMVLNKKNWEIAFLDMTWQPSTMRYLPHKNKIEIGYLTWSSIQPTIQIRQTKSFLKQMFHFYFVGCKNKRCLIINEKLASYTFLFQASYKNWLGWNDIIEYEDLKEQISFTLSIDNITITQPIEVTTKLKYDSDSEGPFKIQIAPSLKIKNLSTDIINHWYKNGIPNTKDMKLNLLDYNTLTTHKEPDKEIWIFRMQIVHNKLPANLTQYPLHKNIPKDVLKQMSFVEQNKNAYVRGCYASFFYPRYKNYVRWDKLSWVDAKGKKVKTNKGKGSHVYIGCQNTNRFSRACPSRKYHWQEVEQHDIQGYKEYTRRKRNNNERGNPYGCNTFCTLAVSAMAYDYLGFDLQAPPKSIKIGNQTFTDLNGNNISYVLENDLLNLNSTTYTLKQWYLAEQKAKEGQLVFITLDNCTSKLNRQCRTGHIAVLTGGRKTNQKTKKNAVNNLYIYQAGASFGFMTLEQGFGYYIYGRPSKIKFVVVPRPTS